MRRRLVTVCHDVSIERAPPPPPPPPLQPLTGEMLSGASSISPDRGGVNHRYNSFIYGTSRHVNAIYTYAIGYGLTLLRVSAEEVATRKLILTQPTRPFQQGHMNSVPERRWSMPPSPQIGIGAQSRACTQRRNARVIRVTFNERLNILVLGS